LNCFRAAVALAVAMLGAACAYDDAQLWGNCCALEIADRESSSKERNTLIAWGRGGFLGDGRSTDWEGRKAAWRKREIALGLADFQKAHPGSQGRDYLTGLGMTCGPVRDPNAEETRCAVGLSVWVTCTVKFGWAFLPNPVPKELSKPIAAILQMTIDVSGSDILDSSVQVMPLPGGRLCHR
jgi:hypothetical protein